MSYTISATRTGIFPFNLCHSTGTWVSTSFSQRRLFMLSQRPKRFRVHLRNRNQFTDTDGGTLTGVIIGIGIPVMGSDGLPTGATTTTPVTLQASTTVTGGTELVTSWITPSTFQIQPYTKYFLTYGFITPATGSTMFGGGLAWQTSANTDALVASPGSLARAASASYLWPWIEYEYADDLAPSILVVGNSLSMVVADAAGNNTGEIGNWHQAWALNQRGFAASLAMAGSFSIQFEAGNGRWGIYDTCAVMPDYDAVIYMAATSSETIQYPIAESAQPDFKGAVDRGKALWPNARHITTNIPPRIEFTGDGTSSATTEYKRVQQNLWHHNLGGGVESCLDVDSLISDMANPARIRTVYNADDTHFTARGHQRIAQLVGGAVNGRRVPTV